MDNTHSAIIEVAVENGSWNQAVTEIESFCERILRQALISSGKAPKFPAEVSVMLGDDAQIGQLNADFRGQNKPTNVLSFPSMTEGDDLIAAQTAGSLFLGDIALAFETIEREALEQNKPFKDHMAHLLVHGTLHLLGFDHDTDIDALAMEQIEIRIMNELGYPDPYIAMGEAL